MNALNEQVGGDYYKNMAFGPLEFCQANRFNALESAAIQHISRHGKKGTKADGLLDCQKAIHEMQMVIALEYQDVMEKQPDIEEKNENHPILQAISNGLGIDLETLRKDIINANEVMKGKCKQGNTLKSLLGFIPDKDTANSLIYAIQRGWIPSVHWMDTKDEQQIDVK